MSDHSELIARLEAASEGTRELDAEIWMLQGFFRELSEKWQIPTSPKPTFVETWRTPGGRELSPFFEDGGIWDDRADVPPHYTTSLDAKLPGENIVEMTWHEVIEGEPLGEVCEAWHEDRDTGKRTLGQGNTEPLARRVAALKAHD